MPSRFSGLYANQECLKPGPNSDLGTNIAIFSYRVDATTKTEGNESGKRPRTPGDSLDSFPGYVFGHERKSKPRDEAVILASVVENRPAQIIGSP
jgi:hypothetical protein